MGNRTGVTDLPRKPLRVAAIQAEPTPGDVAGNAALAARLIRQAGDAGAALAVVPELFLPAYHPPALRADLRGLAVAADESGKVDDPRLDPLRQPGVVAVVGAAVRRPDGRLTLSSLVIDRAGAITAAYDKQNLWAPDEQELFVPGAAGASLVLDGWHLALGICYDGCFPEHGRAAARDGAHGYLCPSAYRIGSQHRRDLYYAARALDNTMYVVFANAVGGVPPWQFCGGAAIYDPEGRPLRRAPDQGEAVITADLDPSELARVRAAQRMLQDLRPSLGGPRQFLTP